MKKRKNNRKLDNLAAVAGGCNVHITGNNEAPVSTNGTKGGDVRVEGDNNGSIDVD